MNGLNAMPLFLQDDLLTKYQSLFKCTALYLIQNLKKSNAQKKVKNKYKIGHMGTNFLLSVKHLVYFTQYNTYLCIVNNFQDLNYRFCKVCFKKTVTHLLLYAIASV